MLDDCCWDCSEPVLLLEGDEDEFELGFEDEELEDELELELELELEDELVLVGMELELLDDCDSGGSQAAVMSISSIRVIDEKYLVVFFMAVPAINFGTYIAS